MQAMEAESNKVVPICNTKYRASSTRRPPGLVRAVSLAKDGAVDYRGKPIDKKTTGRLKANAFIIGKLLFCPCCTFLLKIKKIKNRMLQHAVLQCGMLTTEGEVWWSYVLYKSKLVRVWRCMDDEGQSVSSLCKIFHHRQHVLEFGRSLRKMKSGGPVSCRN